MLPHIVPVSNGCVEDSYAQSVCLSMCCVGMRQLKFTPPPPSDRDAPFAEPVHLQNGHVLSSIRAVDVEAAERLEAVFAARARTLPQSRGSRRACKPQAACATARSGFILLALLRFSSMRFGQSRMTPVRLAAPVAQSLGGAEGCTVARRATHSLWTVSDNRCPAKFACSNRRRCAGHSAVCPIHSG